MTKPALAYGAPAASLDERQDRRGDALVGVGEMDATACLDKLMRAYEDPTHRLSVARPTKAMWMGRARLAAACAAFAVLVGGAAGTLSSLNF